MNIVGTGNDRINFSSANISSIAHGSAININPKQIEVQRSTLENCEIGASTRGNSENKSNLLLIAFESLSSVKISDVSRQNFYH